MDNVVTPCPPVLSRRDKLLNLGINKRPNTLRNKSCPCGSKKKFKKCCWYKDLSLLNTTGGA